MRSLKIIVMIGCIFGLTVSGRFTPTAQAASLTVIKDAGPADGTDVDFTALGIFLRTWGSQGTGDGQFWYPGSVAVDSSGNVYVAESSVSQRIQKFDSSGAYLTQWGSHGTGNGQFQNAESVAVDSSGYVYVVDQYGQRIQKFDSSGAYLGQWGGYGTGDGQFRFPTGVAVDNSGYVYVADPYNFRIQKFDSSGVYIAQWGSLGTGNGQFDYPVSVAVDSSGQVYVADYNNHRIQKFDSSGAYLTQWGSEGSGNGQFKNPIAVAVDNSGLVYVADQDNNRIQVFDSSDAYLTQWGSGGSGEGQFGSPSCVAVDSSGQVYVTDARNHRIQVFNSKFTLDDADPDDGDDITRSITLNDLNAGTYAIAEIVPADWQLDSAVCTGGSDSGSLNGATLSVALGAGEDVVCTFSNVAPDLTATKTNDTDGFINALSGFTWTIAITNSGAAGATFSDGQVIFRDDLSPNGMYAPPTIGNVSNITNPANLACSVAANVLTCVADGGEVTLEADSRFEVALPTTAVAGPTLENPVTNGMCASDPADLIAEADETNNDCADSITIQGRWVSFNKVVSGGTAAPEDFTLNIGSLLHDVPFGDIFLPYGTHIVTENGPDGYIPVDTEFNCALDDEVPGLVVLQNEAGFDFSRCTIVNEAQSGSLTIIKNAAPADGTDVDFTISGAGITPSFLLEWGSDGAGDGQFEDPFYMAVDSSGDVYVTDVENYRIQKFDSNGVYLTQWGGEGTGDGQFYYPYGVAVDSIGNVYVADASNDRVQKFDSNGTYLTQWGGSGTGDGQFDEPTGVAVDSSGNVYVVDYQNRRIQKFDSSGAYLTQWGGSGTGDGQFIRPYDVAVDNNGYVYVADTGNNRIQKFDSNGVYLTQWGGYGSGNGQFGAPKGLAVDSNGHVYVTDETNRRIQKFDSNGAYLNQWGSQGTGDGQFSYPRGVTVDSSGYVYVADTGNQRIQKFSSGFTLDDADPDDGDDITHSMTLNDLTASTYTIAEIVPFGWRLADAACTGGSDSGSLDGKTLSVTIGAGENVVCTFSNILDDVVIPPTPEPAVVPEPATIGLVGVGLLGLLALTRRSRNKRQ